MALLCGAVCFVGSRAFIPWQCGLLRFPTHVAKCRVMNGPPGLRWLCLLLLIDEGLVGVYAGVPGPGGFDLDAARDSREPVAVAAPWPVFGVFDEARLDRVAVEIAKLLVEFGAREDVEVVVAALPELRAVTLELLRCLRLQGAENFF